MVSRPDRVCGTGCRSVPATDRILDARFADPARKALCAGTKLGEAPRHSANRAGRDERGREPSGERLAGARDRVFSRPRPRVNVAL